MVSKQGDRYIISKVKLSKVQYDQLIKRFGELNSYGRTKSEQQAVNKKNKEVKERAEKARKKSTFNDYTFHDY